MVGQLSRAVRVGDRVSGGQILLEADVRERKAPGGRANQEAGLVAHPVEELPGIGGQAGLGGHFAERARGLPRQVGRVGLEAAFLLVHPPGQRRQDGAAGGRIETAELLAGAPVLQQHVHATPEQLAAAAR